MHLEDDLGLDERLAFMEDLVDVFGITVDQDVAYAWTCLRDVIDYMEMSLASKLLPSI